MTVNELQTSSIILVGLLNNITYKVVSPQVAKLVYNSNNCGLWYL